MTTRRLVAEFWAAMQANDWAAAAALFADGYVLYWPQSGERIRGSANFVVINSAYPAAGRWRSIVERLAAAGEATPRPGGNAARSPPPPAPRRPRP